MIEPRHGQALQSREHIAAHVEDDVLFEMIVDQDAEAVEEFAEQKGSEQSQGGGQQQVIPRLFDHCVNDI